MPPTVDLIPYDQNKLPEWVYQPGTEFAEFKIISIILTIDAAFYEVTYVGENSTYIVENLYVAEVNSRDLSWKGPPKLYLEQKNAC